MDKKRLQELAGIEQLNEAATLYVVKIAITAKDINDVINTLNRHEIEEGETPLTLKEVQSNPELLKYLFDGVDWKEATIGDPEEYWNADGWDEFKKYRKGK